MKTLQNFILLIIFTILFFTCRKEYFYEGRYPLNDSDKLVIFVWLQQAVLPQLKNIT